MRRAVLTILIFFWIPELAVADVVLAARTLRSRTILTASDLILLESELPGTVSKISDVVGLETRVTVYKGRPISISDIGPAAIIERNQTVKLVYSAGLLTISAEGRSLARGGVGDRVRVINLSSKITVFGVISEDGEVVVGTVGTP